MSANEEFFRERRTQAVFKHGILSRYPVVFASKTGWRDRDVVFLDGYAGRGEYGDGSPGSPALLAASAEKVAGFRQVRGIFVEKRHADYLNLQAVMASYNRPEDQVLEGDLRDHLAAILDNVTAAALFAFLDPFGTALDRSQLVNELLCRQSPAPVEVLLHISVSSVARLGGLLRKRRLDGIALSEADLKSIDHVNRFLGGDWWQAHFEPMRDSEDQERATDAALRVAAEYMGGVCRETGCQAVRMPIRAKPGQLPKYILVLFTRHLDGMWFFADAVGKAGRDWHGACLDEIAANERAKADLVRARQEAIGQFDLFKGLGMDIAPTPQPDFDPEKYERENRAAWTSAIASNITNLLTEEGPFILASKVEDVYGTVLGAAGARHARAAIKDLHDAGVVSNTGGGRDFHREWIRPTDQPATGTGS